MSNLPDNSITSNGIESHIDNYFIARESTLRFKDFMRVYAIKNMSKSGKARELGIVLNTYKRWAGVIKAHATISTSTKMRQENYNA